MYYLVWVLLRNIPESLVSFVSGSSLDGIYARTTELAINLITCLIVPTRLQHMIQREIFQGRFENFLTKLLVMNP